MSFSFITVIELEGGLILIADEFAVGLAIGRLPDDDEEGGP